MIKILLITFTALFFIITINAQITTFQRTYKTPADEFSGSAIETSNGDFISVGITYPGPMGNDDAYILRTDHNGQTIWATTLGDTSDQQIVHIVEDGTTDNFYIVGKTDGQGANNSDALFGKIDGNGNLLWLKAYGGTGDENTRRMIRDTNGDFYICGSTSSFGAGGLDGFVFKVDDIGNLLWSKSMGGAGDEWARTIGIDAMGRLVVGGYQNSFSLGQADVCISTMDTQGNIIWSYSYGTDKGDKMEELITDANGNITGVGNTKLRIDSNSTLISNAFMMQVDSLGNQNWMKIYADSTTVDRCWRIIDGIGGGYVLTGQSNLDTAVTDSTTELRGIRTTSTGDLVWANVFGGTHRDKRPDVVQTIDGGYLFSAGSASFAPDTSRDVYFIKTDTNGFSGCNTLPKTFMVVDTSFAKDTITWIEGTGAIETTLSWTALSTELFINDTLCEDIFIGIENNLNKNEIVIYPNPTRGKIRVKAENIENIEVLNLQGKEILNSKKQEIDLRKEPKGIYIIKVTTSNGTAVEKLILY